nr:MAG: hypothetical protein [Grapevine virus H]WIM49036.1 MAG: hypothetical protein [Grapevine virus H]WIM49051.1 MAG: hypothetical protein [Grapevine virus H]
MDLADFIGRTSEYSECVTILDLFNLRDLAVEQHYSSLEELVLCAHWEGGRVDHHRALGCLVKALGNKARGLALNYTLFAKLGVREPTVILDHLLDFLVCKRRLPPIDLLDLTDKNLKVSLHGNSLSGRLICNNKVEVRSRFGTGVTRQRLSSLDKVILGHAE